MNVHIASAERPEASCSRRINDAPLTASGTLPTAIATTSTSEPPAVSETPSAVFSGTPSRKTPIISAGPMADDPSLVSTSRSATT